MATERVSPSWFNQLEDGVVLIRAGVVVDINRAAATMLDVNPDSAAGRLAIAVLRDHRLEQAYRDGSTTELSTRGRVLRAWGIAGGLCLRDITAMSRAQENARELLAVLSHELRTPVTTIRSTLEALHYDVPAEQRQHFLQCAETETHRLIRLLEDLTIDVKPPYARSLDVADIVSRALSLLQDTFAERNIAVECALEPLTVWADTDKLLQVLINLLENAAIHGPNNAIIYLTAYQYPALTTHDVPVAGVTNRGVAEVLAHRDTPISSSLVKSDMAYITVRDLGTPLEPDIVERLFEPHAQGSPKSKGTGLGLYIVRSIAARWGGKAWGQPYADGNEFGVSVPLSSRKRPA